MKKSKILPTLVILCMFFSTMITLQNNQYFEENKENQLTLDAENKYENKLKLTNDLDLQNNLASTMSFTVSLLNALNGNPIPNAEVIVYNDTFSAIVLTDFNGNAYLDIYPNMYSLNMTANGYVSSLQVQVYFYSPGTYIFYLDPYNAVGITSNDIVLEQSEYILTYLSTTNGTIYNYSIYVNSVIVTTTFSTGLVLSPMNPGVYNITVLMNSSYGAFTDQIDLFVIGIKFTNITNGSVVNGGLILVQFDYVQDYTPAPLKFNYFIAQVNGDQYINTNDYQVRNIALPIFDNGTNEFQFLFDFGPLGQLQYALHVDVENVVPALDVAVGDYWKYSIKTFDPGTYTGTEQIVNVDVKEKLALFVVNMTVSFTVYDITTHNIVSSANGWLKVNTINGYIEDSGGNLNLPIDTLWLIFTGLQNGYSDIVLFNFFYDVGFKISESSYNGIKTWSTNMSIIPSQLTWEAQYMQSSGILLYFSYSMNALQLQEIKLLSSTYLPTIPNLIYNDVTIEQGSSNALSWNIEGSYSGNYIIYVDSIETKNDYWTSGIETIYDLSSLPEGNHNITAVFFNTFGQYSVYYTIVHVLAGTSPITTTVTTTISTTITGTETSTTVTTSTSTTIQTTISTLISDLINTTTKTTTGFSIVIMFLGISGALMIRRKRNKVS